MMNHRHFFIVFTVLFLFPVFLAGAVPLSAYRGDSLVINMIEGLSRDADEIAECDAELYLKGNIHALKKNFLLDFVPDMIHFSRGVKEYFSESYYKIYFNDAGVFDVKFKGATGTFKYDSGEWEQLTTFFQTNVFLPTFLSGDVISPLDNTSENYYTYSMDSLWTGEDSLMLCKVSFAPKLKSIKLFSGGYIHLNMNKEGGYEICDLFFKGSAEQYDYEMLLTMNDIKSMRLPEKMNLKLNYRFFWNKIDFNYEGIFAYTRIVPKDSLNNADVSVYKDNSVHDSIVLRNQQQMSRYRLMELSDREREMYVRFNNEKKKARGDTANSRQRLDLISQTGEALLSSHSFYLNDRAKFRMAPIICPSYLSYNSNTGISYKLKSDLSLNLNNDRSFKLRPQVGYNFKLKEIYWKCDNDYVYWPQREGCFQLSIGNGNRIYSSDVLDKIKSLSDSSNYNFESLHLDYFRNFYIKFNHGIEVSNGLFLITGILFNKRTLIDPLSLAEKEHDVGLNFLSSVYRSFAPYFTVEWTPARYYYMRGKQKVFLYSRYPTFRLDWEQGVKGVFGSGTKYSRAEMDVSYRLPCSSINKLFFRAGGGAVFNHGDLYFVDYNFFSHSNLPSGWNDDFGGKFQLLDSHWYNAANSYLKGHVVYESPFFLLHHIFKNVSYIQSERVYLNALYMAQLRPYLELGYGLETPFFDTGVFVSNQNGKFHSVGCKFTLTLFQE